MYIKFPYISYFRISQKSVLNSTFHPNLNRSYFICYFPFLGMAVLQKNQRLQAAQRRLSSLMLSVRNRKSIIFFYYYLQLFVLSLLSFAFFSGITLAGFRTCFYTLDINRVYRLYNSAFGGLLVTNNFYYINIFCLS